MWVFILYSGNSRATKWYRNDDKISRRLEDAEGKYIIFENLAHPGKVKKSNTWCERG